MGPPLALAPKFSLHPIKNHILISDGPEKKYWVSTSGLHLSTLERFLVCWWLFTKLIHLVVDCYWMCVQSWLLKIGVQQLPCWSLKKLQPAQFEVPRLGHHYCPHWRHSSAHQRTCNTASLVCALVLWALCALGPAADISWTTLWEPAWLLSNINWRDTFGSQPSLFLGTFCVHEFHMDHSRHTVNIC